MIYLDAEELLYIAERAIGEPLVIRDRGLLEAAAARPQSTWLGSDTYLTIEEKAAALIHSLVSNHALVDGNKRLGLAGLLTFLDVNGYELSWNNDEAFEFTMQVADGDLSNISEMAAQLHRALVPVQGLHS